MSQGLNGVRDVESLCVKEMVSMASFGAVRDIPIADIRRTLEYMKIATWNVERLKHYKDISLICQEIEKCDADIFVLTETDSRLLPT